MATQIGSAPVTTGEFLRAICSKDGSTTYLIDPGALDPDPATFGLALVDCIRHGARAWSEATGVDEVTVLDRIWQAFDAERAHPTTELN
jgi:hypothetical protein